MSGLSEYGKLLERLSTHSHRWLITGVAGFIGSNLLEALLKLNQRVIGLGNEVSHRQNLLEVQNNVSPAQWHNFSFMKGDIRQLNDCKLAAVGVDYVLHHAAFGGVPRSIEDPILTNAINVDGFLNMLVASREAGVKRFIYASSSSTYGDDTTLPKVEDKIGKPLSPYALTKYVNELYADLFSRTYGLPSIGLRYFNIFGKRQDLYGNSALVIPKWIASMINNEPIYINGDGETSRDFCYVDDVVQANLLAALCDNKEAVNQVYNIAASDCITLNELYQYLHGSLLPKYPHLDGVKATHLEFRMGDIRHSFANISKAAELLGYAPAYCIKNGLGLVMDWYTANIAIKKQ